MTNVVSMVPSKPDAELAEEFKLRIIEAYKPILTIMDDALKANFMINVNTGYNALDQHVITHLVIARKFV